MDTEPVPSLDYGIPAPENYLPGTPDWIWWVLASGILAFLLLLWGSLRRLIPKQKSSPSCSKQDLQALALQKIKSLEAEVETRPLARIAAESSLAIRTYLAGSLSEPSLYETAEEFQARQGELPASINRFLNELSDAKYAKSAVDGDLSQKFLQRSETCIKELSSMAEQEIQNKSLSSDSVAEEMKVNVWQLIAEKSKIVVPLGLLVALIGFLSAAYQEQRNGLKFEGSTLILIALGISLCAFLFSLQTNRKPSGR